MKKIALSALLSCLALTACGGGGGGSTPDNSNNNGNNGGNTGNSALITKLAACPVVSQSADPIASTCLTGTYTGKDSSGAACSLTITAGGNYTFSSSRLGYSYTLPADAFRLFTHSDQSRGNHQVLWGVMGTTIDNSTPTYITMDKRELDFNATWGPDVAGSPRIQIDAKKTFSYGTTTTESATCVVPL